MAITQLDLIRLSERFDGEFNVADFTEEELEEMLQENTSDESSEKKFREKYFNIHDDIKYRHDIKKKSS
jgi:hypothetical protein